MKIIRSRHEDHFTIFPNALIRDERLSYRARGVLMELLSRTPDWQTTADDMAKSAKRKRGPKGEGRDAMRGAFAELKAAGYIVVVTTVGKDGAHRSELHVYDVPQDVTSNDAQKRRSDRRTDFQSSETQSSADQSSENQSSLRSTDDGSTDERSTEEEESSALAAARAGQLASSQARDEQADKRRREEQQHQRTAELNRRWDLVDALSPNDLRAVMLKLEKQRPAIYRKVRQDALKQHKGDGITGTPKGVDNLACKYAVLHYANKGILTPAFLAKPLGLKDTA